MIIKVLNSRDKRRIIVQYYPQQPYSAPQYPVQPYPPQRYVQPMTEEEYRQKNYRRLLRRTANSVGALMLVFFGLEIILSVLILLISGDVGNDIAETATNTYFLLENGVLSVLIFFAGGLVYCLIRRVRFAELFPFEKTGGAMLMKLSVIGLTFSLISNYVVDMINNTFGLFGVENKGGTFDTGSEPNVLLYFLTVAILPALVEEFAFRGIVMGMMRPYSEGLAILVSSATFALMHGNFVQMPFTFCCGMVFAFIDIKANSLLPSIIIHFLNNALSVLYDILTSYNILTENEANIAYAVIFLVTAILSFVFIKGLVNRDDGSLFTLKNGDSGILFKNKVKTVASSPTLIVFAVLMGLYSCMILFFS